MIKINIKVPDLVMEGMANFEDGFKECSRIGKSVSLGFKSILIHGMSHAVEQKLSDVSCNETGKPATFSVKMGRKNIQVQVDLPKSRQAEIEKFSVCNLT